MNILEGINFFRDRHVSTPKLSTQHSYNYLLSKLQQSFASQPLNTISADDVPHFLESMVGTASKSTRRLKYAQVKSFKCFQDNYIILQSHAMKAIIMLDGKHGLETSDNYQKLYQMACYQNML